MEAFLAYFSGILDLFKMPFTVYGFTFSFWDIFLFTTAAGIVLSFIGRVMYD